MFTFLLSFVCFSGFPVMQKVQLWPCGVLLVQQYRDLLYQQQHLLYWNRG